MPPPGGDGTLVIVQSPSAVSIGAEAPVRYPSRVDEALKDPAERLTIEPEHLYIHGIALEVP